MLIDESLTTSVFTQTTALSTLGGIKQMFVELEQFTRKQPIQLWNCCQQLSVRRVKNLLKQQITSQDYCGETWVLYKSPLTKRSCDLQQQILHAAVAFNAFVSLINLNVRNAREKKKHGHRWCCCLKGWFKARTLSGFFKAMIVRSCYAKGVIFTEMEN